MCGSQIQRADCPYRNGDTYPGRRSGCVGDHCQGDLAGSPDMDDLHCCRCRWHIAFLELGMNSR